MPFTMLLRITEQRKIPFHLSGHSCKSLNQNFMAFIENSVCFVPGSEDSENISVNILNFLSCKQDSFLKLDLDQTKYQILDIMWNHVAFSKISLLGTMNCSSANCSTSQFIKGELEMQTFAWLPETCQL